MKRSSLQDFEKALKMLDDLLEKEGIDSIDIYAIGGFAMMYYGVRQDGYTIDIDSLSSGYDNKVVSLIKSVGNELGIDSDWLNTDCASLDGFMTLGETIAWKRTKYEFRHINLMIPDMNGLIMTKAKAINDGGLVPRTTDKKDIVAALRFVGITDITELDISVDYAFIKKQYDRCYEYLKLLSKWGNQN